jgi:trigger factor
MSIVAEITSIDEGRVELAVAVSEDAVEQAFDQALQRLARGVKVPGFRQGKVPTSVVMSRFGRPVVVQEMLKVSLVEWYEQAVEEAGIRPIDDPDLALDDVPETGELRFHAAVQTRPKATLGTIAGLEVGKEEPEIPEGALDAELERLRMQGSRMSPVDRPAREGDFLVVDFDGTVAGRRLPSASARDYVVELGSERLIAGFDEKLRGKTQGDSVTIEVTYADDDSRPELRGKTVDYTAAVKQVQERVLPELDDDFAAENSEFDTLEELKADINGRLQAAAQARVDELFRRRVLDAVVTESTVEVPEVMVQRRIGTILTQTASALPSGVTFETYLRATGRTIAQLAEELRPDAEMAIRRELAVEAVCEAEGIEVTDADVEAQVREDAEKVGRDADELLAEVVSEGAFERLREDLRLGRAVQFLIDNAVPISMEHAEARERLWTPEEEKVAPDAKLWTPGDAK